MRNIIRRWLGLTAIESSISGIENDTYYLREEITKTRNELKVTNRAIGRIIAKVDPLSAIPEDNNARRAASDKLSDEIIAKLTGEVQASNRFSS